MRQTRFRESKSLYLLKFPCVASHTFDIWQLDVQELGLCMTIRTQKMQYINSKRSFLDSL